MKFAKIVFSGAISAACALLNSNAASADEPPAGEPPVPPSESTPGEVAPPGGTTPAAPPPEMDPAGQPFDASGQPSPPIATMPTPVDPTSQSSTASDRESTVRWHGTVGAEVLGGDAFSVGFRHNLGVTWNLLPDARISPSIGVLATFGSSYISVDDARALDGSLKIGQLDFGAGAQLGLSVHRVGFVESRLFVTGALLRVVVDDRLRFDQVAGIVDTPYGYRATAGINWFSALLANSDDDNNDKEDLSWLAILLPHQLEFVWQRSAGSDRYGAALSWGF